MSFGNEGGVYGCKHNAGVACEVQRCSACGFNPAVREKRLRKMYSEQGIDKEPQRSMGVDRACDILNPDGVERYAAPEYVELAHRMAIQALRDQQERERRHNTCEFCKEYKIKRVAPYDDEAKERLALRSAYYCFRCGRKIEREKDD